MIFGTVSPQQQFILPEDLVRLAAIRHLPTRKAAPVSAYTSLLAVLPEWFEEINTEFNFTIDLAASDQYHTVEKYFTEEDDAFTQEWEGTGWLSPPWEDVGLGLWILKTVEEVQQGKADTIVALLPYRPESRWWSIVEENTFEIRPIQAQFQRMYDGSTNDIQVEPHVLAIFRKEGFVTKHLQEQPSETDDGHKFIMGELR